MGRGGGRGDDVEGYGKGPGDFNTRSGPSIEAIDWRNPAIFDTDSAALPRLKIISAQGGGFLPSYADRSDHACFVNPSACDPNITLKKKPTEYLKQLYFDSLIFSPEALRHLAAQVGVGQIMLGSDHPYPWENRTVLPKPAAREFETKALDVNVG